MKIFLVNSIGRLDLVAWLLVLCFFGGSSLLFGGNTLLAFGGAIGIIVEMLLIGLAIEIIIECLKNKKGIGTLTGFITNGPEAVCLLVGLIVGDIIFAASTPLGSNFHEPPASHCCRDAMPPGQNDIFDKQAVQSDHDHKYNFVCR